MTKHKGAILTLTVIGLIAIASFTGLLIGRETGKQEARAESAVVIGGAASTLMDAYYSGAELERAGILLKGGDCQQCRLIALILNNKELSFDDDTLAELFQVLGCDNALVRVEAVVGESTSYRISDAFCGVNARVISSARNFE